MCTHSFRCFRAKDLAEFGLVLAQNFHGDLCLPLPLRIRMLSNGFKVLFGGRTKFSDPFGHDAGLIQRDLCNTYPAGQ